MNTELEVNLQCLKCGGTVIELPDNPTDDSIAKCKACGATLGNLGDINSQIGHAAVDRVSSALGDIFADAFRGSKNITFEKN